MRVHISGKLEERGGEVLVTAYLTSEEAARLNVDRTDLRRLGF